MGKPFGEVLNTSLQGTIPPMKVTTTLLLSVLAAKYMLVEVMITSLSVLLGRRFIRVAEMIR